MALYNKQPELVAQVKVDKVFFEKYLQGLLTQEEIDGWYEKHQLNSIYGGRKGAEDLLVSIRRNLDAYEVAVCGEKKE